MNEERFVKCIVEEDKSSEYFTRYILYGVWAGGERQYMGSFFGPGLVDPFIAVASIAEAQCDFWLPVDVSDIWSDSEGDLIISIDYDL